MPPRTPVGCRWAGQRAWRGWGKAALLSSVAAGTATLAPHPDAPVELQELMARCMDVNPSHRPAMGEALQVLEQLLARERCGS